MSGNEERTNNVRCPYCGSEKFALVTYGYNMKYFNSDTLESYERGWESTENDGWQCDSCERLLPVELRQEIYELQ